jgi:hypothetical protein
MSTENTNGTETKHTPGPWLLDHRLAYKLGPNGSNAFTASVQRGGTRDDSISEEECHANAVRIVSCVNSCEGINPEAVPDLLAALEMTPLDIHPADEQGDCLCSQCSFRKAARAATAKAKGARIPLDKIINT